MWTTARKCCRGASWRPTCYTDVEGRSLSASSPRWAVPSRAPAVPYRVTCGSVSSGTKMEVSLNTQALKMKSKGEMLQAPVLLIVV